MGLNLGWGSEAWSTRLSLSTDAVLSKDCRTFEATQSLSSLESFSAAASVKWSQRFLCRAQRNVRMQRCRHPGVSKEFWKCTKLFWAIWKWWELFFPFLYGKREKTQSCMDQIRIPKIICFQQVAYRKGWACGVSRGCNIFISTLNVTDVRIRIQSADTSVLWEHLKLEPLHMLWTMLVPFKLQEPSKKEQLCFLPAVP